MDCPWDGANEDSPCGGRMTPDGLCMNHSILFFDWWGCNGGYDFYETLPRLEARARADKWHKGLDLNDLDRILRD
ncbi:hypothetical protein LCGC14_1410410 [marine sediment metagenome]|uniref:Uncharacterized protein n=1 Tax=marine sediment metagenome TaxID=412755 RepID=A0A0F9JUR9_9ZZZZ